MVERKTSRACLACEAECCRKLAVQMQVGPQMRELLAAHYGREVDNLRVKVLHDCPHLTANNLCDLWHEDPEQDHRPELCKIFFCEKAENPGLLILPVREVVLDLEL